MRFARAFELDRVLARFRQLARIGRADRRIAEPIEYPGRRKRRIGEHAFLVGRELFEECAEAVGIGDPHRVAEMRRQCRRQLAAVDEEIDRLVAMEHGEAQRQRRMRHVAAADIEQPGDRIRRRQHHRVGTLLGEAGGDARALGRRALAGEADLMRHDRRRRRRGPVVPDRVDRIAVERDQLAAGFFGRGAIARDLAKRMQPRVVTERLAGFQTGLDPGTRRLVADMAVLDRAGHRLRRQLGGYSDHRRRSPPYPCRATASPAEPVKPVSQASRCADAGTYSP